jgi:16S rRNA G1207 methylase RsmC
MGLGLGFALGGLDLGKFVLDGGSGWGVCSLVFLENQQLKHLTGMTEK